MTESKVHSERKVKNLFMLGILLLFVVFVFAITIVKLKVAADMAKENASKPADSTTIGTENPLSKLEPTKN